MILRFSSALLKHVNYYRRIVKNHKQIFYFSTVQQKSQTQKVKSSSSNQGHKSQQQDHQTQNIQKQKAEKLQSQKMRNISKRINKIKEDQEHSQMQQIQKKIQLTAGQFNPLTAYIWLYRRTFLGLFVFLAFAGYALKFANFSGLYEDPLTNRKKWMIINKRSEQKLDEFILSLFKREKQFIDLKGSSSLINRKLSQTVSKLNEKLGEMASELINEDPKQDFKIHIIDQEDFTITILPRKNIIISKKILISSQIGSLDVANTTFLLYVLFLRRYHIKDLGVKQKSYFCQSQVVSDNIKLGKVYIRNYSKLQILQTLRLLNNKVQTLNSQNYPIQPKFIKSLRILAVASKHNQVKHSLYNRLSLSTLFQDNQQLALKHEQVK